MAQSTVPSLDDRQSGCDLPNLRRLWTIDQRLEFSQQTDAANVIEFPLRVVSRRNRHHSLLTASGAKGDISGVPKASVFGTLTN